MESPIVGAEWKEVHWKVPRGLVDHPRSADRETDDGHVAMAEHFRIRYRLARSGFLLKYMKLKRSTRLVYLWRHSQNRIKLESLRQ